ncbi:MAG: hypothetical protein HKL79_07030 [Thermoplasmata archaeon]|nr:hypothetical protein [Thermoplasmata archaeon]
MSLALPYTRSVLTNRSLWFWGVVFMAFWFVLGAYVFSGGLPATRSAEVAYTSSWYAVIALFSLTTLAMGIATSISYGTSALAFGFRYTRLTPRAFALSLMAAAGVMGLFLSFIMAGVVSGLFSAHFGTTILPANLAAIVGVSILSGAFMMGLATTLVLVVVNHLGLRSMSFVEFVPLILSYIFGFAQLFLALPAWVLYLSPWNDMESLLFQAFSGSPARIVLTDSASPILAWPLLVGAIVVWVVVLVGVASVLLRGIRSVSVQEGRQI